MDAPILYVSSASGIIDLDRVILFNLTLQVDDVIKSSESNIDVKFHWPEESQVAKFKLVENTSLYLSVVLPRSYVLLAVGSTLLVFNNAVTKTDFEQVIKFAANVTAFVDSPVNLILVVSIVADCNIFEISVFVSEI